MQYISRTPPCEYNGCYYSTIICCNLDIEIYCPLINTSHNYASGHNVPFFIIISWTIMAISIFKPFSFWLTDYTLF